MLKKLKDFFIEEIEEIEEIDAPEVKEVPFSPAPKQPSETLNETEPVVTNRKVLADLRLDPPLKEPLVEEPVEKMPEIDESELVDELDYAYEFMPVISPIFGIAPADQPMIKKQLTGISTASQATSSILGTVLSPIYGSLKPMTPLTSEPTELTLPRKEQADLDSIDDLISEFELTPEEEDESFTLFNQELD